MRIWAFSTPRALKKRPYEKPHSHHSNAITDITAGLSCIWAFSTPRALKKRPYEKPHNHHSNTAIDTNKAFSTPRALKKRPYESLYENSCVDLNPYGHHVNVIITATQSSILWQFHLA